MTFFGERFVDVCEHGMGMIFVRSKDGISHNPSEWIQWRITLMA